MHKAKPFLDKDSSLQRYFSYINSYINDANLTETNTHKTNLKKIYSEQEHAIRWVHIKDRYFIPKNFLYPAKY